MHLERVKARADTGGHSASEATLRRIYEASLMNLRRAVQELDVVWVYDNTDINSSHPLVFEAHSGEIHFLVDNPPDWLRAALMSARPPSAEDLAVVLKLASRWQNVTEPRVSASGLIYAEQHICRTIIPAGLSPVICHPTV